MALHLRAIAVVAAGAVILVLLAVTGASAPVRADTPADSPAAHTAAGNVDLASAAVARYVQRTVVVGRSVRGRPVRAYFKGYPAARRVVLVLGQMHGDERAGRATVTWIRRHVRPQPGTAVWLLPTMNPDGNARRTRVNARGVDLNRNWPTSGWKRTTRGSRYYSGPRRASEPETRAMMRFLAKVKPTYIASIHQPLRGIGRAAKAKPYQIRLSRNLRLPRKSFGVGNPSGTVSPTLTGWYNKRYRGVAITIEYGARTSARFRNLVAGRGIARASGLI